MYLICYNYHDVNIITYQNHMDQTAYKKSRYPNNLSILEIESKIALIIDINFSLFYLFQKSQISTFD